MSNTLSLQEVLFVAHFSAGQPLTVLDAAHWYDGLAARYPVFQQQPAWQPMIWQDIGGSAINPPGVPQLLINQTLMPRFVGISEDQRWSVHLQGDRIAMGWRRLEPTGKATPYPGFETVHDSVAVFLNDFSVWWLQRFGVQIDFQICELNYFNAFPFVLPERTLRVSEIFKFVIPQQGKTLANLNASWIEPTEGPRHERVHCFTAMGATLDCPSAALFNFMGMAKLRQQDTLSELRSVFESLHTAITSAYIGAINTNIIGSQE